MTMRATRIPSRRWLALVSLWLLAGCATVEREMRELASADPRDRRSAVLWLKDYLLDRDEEETRDARPKILVRLRSLAERDPDPMVRADALATLARASPSIDPAVFLDRLSDAHWEVRREAIRGLVAHRDPRAPERIVAHLDRSESFFVRLEALHAVLAYRTEAAYGKLIEILRDVGEEDRLRHAAYAALRELTGLPIPFDVYRWQRWYDDSRSGPETATGPSPAGQPTGREEPEAGP
ncbi:MAG: HEAT repeat domain-containing protein [Planctomycetes bacterium]|nr:HEAT repeat domain-containing protein [Planctomycetota bacterium]